MVVYSVGFELINTQIRQWGSFLAKKEITGLVEAYQNVSPVAKKGRCRLCPWFDERGDKPVERIMLVVMGRRGNEPAVDVAAYNTSVKAARVRKWLKKSGVKKTKNLQAMEFVDPFYY